MKTFIYFKKKCAKTSREEQLLSNFVKEPKMRKKKTKVCGEGSNREKSFQKESSFSKECIFLPRRFQ